MLPRELSQCGFARRLAAAEDCELAPARHQLGHDCNNHVDAFLMGQTAHHANQRNSGVHVEPHVLLQRAFINAFVGQIVGIVMRGNMRIGTRIPRLLVDTIQDAAEVIAPRGEQALQPHAQRGMLNFFGVGRAHAGDAVGIKQPGLEERHAAVIFKAVDLKTFRRQPKPGQAFRWKNTLERQIMDGNEAGWFAARHEMQVGRRQAALPIVTVDDIRAPRQRRFIAAKQRGDITEQPKT